MKIVHVEKESGVVDVFDFSLSTISENALLPNLRGLYDGTVKCYTVMLGIEVE
jgi:hypothetical protein